MMRDCKQYSPEYVALRAAGWHVVRAINGVATMSTAQRDNSLNRWKRGPQGWVRERKEIA